jgi:hypothetical protein
MAEGRHTSARPGQSSSAGPKAREDPLGGDASPEIGEEGLSRYQRRRDQSPETLGLHVDRMETIPGRSGTPPGTIGVGGAEHDWSLRTERPAEVEHQLGVPVAEEPAPRVEEPIRPPRVRRARPKTWVEFRVVWADTGQPVPSVRLTVTTPDGNQAFHTTNAEGAVTIKNIDPGTCDISGRRDQSVERTLDFVQIGEATGDGGGSTDPRSSPDELWFIADIEKHKVKAGESLKSLAESVGMTWRELARFNWGTDVPAKINEHLRDDVGCTRKTADGHNYRFHDSDHPGIVYLPSEFVREGLATTRSHTIQVRLVEDEIEQFEVWVRAFDHWAEVPLGGKDYTLSGPTPGGSVVRSGTTDRNGDLRERNLPFGEYELEIGDGSVIVAARCQEDIGAADGGRKSGTVTWPDAMRVHGAELDDADAEAEYEPGEEIPFELGAYVDWDEHDASGDEEEPEESEFEDELDGFSPGAE